MKDLKDTLHKFGYKATSPRLLILGAFSKVCNPMSANDIWNSVKKKSVDRATVYRTLSSFEEAKLIRRVPVGKDAVFYELALYHHHHIICTSCDKISEFEDDSHGEILKKAILKAKDFVTITHHSFDLFGICNKCFKKSK